MLGVLVNAAAVILGSLVGLLLKKGLPKKVTKTVMAGLGLCTLYIGVRGAMEGENSLILIGSIVIGSIIGSLIDIDGLLCRLGDRVEQRFKKNGAGDGKTSLSEGFVSGTLLFCVGAMTIVGSLNAGLRGDNEMLFTKSMLDLFSSMMLSVTLGIGVMLSAAAVFVIQGAFVLLAGLLEPIMTASCIAEITCAGSIMIMAIGLNLIGVTKIKVANMIPALVLAPAICHLLTLF